MRFRIYGSYFLRVNLPDWTRKAENSRMSSPPFYSEYHDLALRETLSIDKAAERRARMSDVSLGATRTVR